jgi:hypothetical protein
MSETSSLSELARFVGQSGLVGESAAASRVAVNDIVRHMEGRPVRQKVSDLLGVVLTLSARTRRMVMPRVEIDLDVFDTNGKRAAALMLTARD